MELYDTSLRKTTATLSGNAAHAVILQFATDGKMLACANSDGAVHVWNVEKREVASTLKGHSSVVLKILFAPDGQTLLTSDSCESKLWNLADGSLRTNLAQANCPMVFTPDSRTLITAPGEVHFWQVATGD